MVGGVSIPYRKFNNLFSRIVKSVAPPPFPSLIGSSITGHGEYQGKA